MNTMLYQSPGPKARPEGTYGWKVFDDADVEAALKAGWHRTPIEAIEAASGAIDEYAAPTREEMEAKAKELGVSFNKRTSDETLLRRIEKAL